MSVTEAAARARVDALIDRIMTEEPRITDRGDAFMHARGRRWITGAGPETVEFERDGIRYMLTGRGNQVAEEHLAAMEARAA